MKLESKKFAGLFNFLPKSGLKAADGLPKGPFPFFTSSPEQKKWTDSPVYNVEALVFGTGGSASVHHANAPFSTSSDCLVATAKDSEQLSSRFCYHYLQWNIQVIEAGFRGVGLKHVSKSHIEGLVLPTPPKAEQQRIAHLLDQAESVRTKRRAALAELDVLTQSIFLEMFGDPANKGWVMTTIADVVNKTDGGIRTGPFGSQLLHSEFTDHGIAVLGIDNAVANEFQWGERRFISEAKYRQLKRYTVRPGDVLITIMGTCGRCAIVPDDIPPAINTKHLCCITLHPAKCLPIFLHAYFLRHPIALKYLNQTSKGAIMSGLNMGLIKEMPLPLPPLSLQRDFARRATAVEELKAKQRTALTELNSLFASLQNRAFRGEL